MVHASSRQCDVERMQAHAITARVRVERYAGDARAAVGRA